MGLGMEGRRAVPLTVSPSESILIENKFIFPKYVFPMAASGKQSSIFISANKLSQLNFTPILLERGGEHLGGSWAASQS